MSVSSSDLLNAALNGTLVDSDDEVIAAPIVDTTTPQANPDEEAQAPILSKSGGYTIPFEKLADARQAKAIAEQEATALREQVSAMQEQIAGLTAQQKQDIAQAAPDEALGAAMQAIEGGVDAAIFGDFSEEALAKGIAKLTQSITAQTESKLRSEFQAMLSPLMAEKAASATQSHYGEIYKAHPDADDIVESAEFESWKASLPAFAKHGVDGALTTGSVKDVIDVFSAFKQAKPSGNAEIQPQRVPYSLSEVPGAAPTDATDQVIALSGNSNGLLDRLNKMSSEQLDALMDRI